jgi:hypothetical protein
MILNFFIAIVTRVIDFFFGYLPTATLADIPYIGEAVQEILTRIVLQWNAFEATFPYVTALYQVFLYVIIPFELAVLVVRFVLGNRTPVSH